MVPSGNEVSGIPHGGKETWAATLFCIRLAGLFLPRSHVYINKANSFR
jgi:hypothetical protein